jgi:hypothetical protein
MTSSWTSSFDTFTLQARLHPAFLTVLPMAALVVTFGQQTRAASYSPLLIAFGGLFFLANFVRSRGKKLEQELLRQWGGWPTTLYLRNRTIGNRVIVARWRAALEKLAGESLPSAAEEQADPAGSDARYYAATRFLIARVDSKADLFPRVREENIAYNFRRNLLALKPLGLWIVAGCLVLDVIVLVSTRKLMPVAVAFGIHLLALAAWLVVVKAEWVREQGCTYAERLLGTLDSNQLE